MKPCCSGKCRGCSHKLNELVLTEAEFEKLKYAFLDPVLIGKNIFLKTKPTELESYINFLKKLDHIDIVLDGLNIALSPTRKYASGSVQMLNFQLTTIYIYVYNIFISVY